MPYAQCPMPMPYAPSYLIFLRKAIFLVEVISSPSNYSSQTMLLQQGLGAFLLMTIVRRAYD
jgi:hypothetical protein